MNASAIDSEVVSKLSVKASEFPISLGTLDVIRDYASNISSLVLSMVVVVTEGEGSSIERQQLVLSRLLNVSLEHSTRQKHFGRLGRRMAGE